MARSLLAFAGMKTTTIWAFSLILGLAGVAGCSEETRENMQEDTGRAGEDLEQGVERGGERIDQGFETPSEEEQREEPLAD